MLVMNKLYLNSTHPTHTMYSGAMKGLSWNRYKRVKSRHMITQNDNVDTYSLMATTSNSGRSCRIRNTIRPMRPNLYIIICGGWRTEGTTSMIGHNNHVMQCAWLPVDADFDGHFWMVFNGFKLTFALFCVAFVFAFDFALRFIFELR
jgi:hypothetical protein